MSTSVPLPPEWAIEKARTILKMSTPSKEILRWSGCYPSTLAVAEYIATKEEPPIDPDLVLARQHYAKLFGTVRLKEQISEGLCDNHPSFCAIVAAIKEVRSQYSVDRGSNRA